MGSQLLGLEEWFAPLDLAEFRRKVLGQQLVVLPPRPELADRLVKDLALGSIDDLLRLRGAKVYAWFQKLDGSQTAAIVPAVAGRRLYEAGTTLYFRGILEFGAQEREVAKHFGVPPSSVECTLFCNRPSARTRAHFDTADIFSIQLRGRKTWRIAPNEFAPAPLRNWATLHPLAPELRQYADGLPPTEMPENATSYTLEKGGILHMPRGYWHDTFSDEDSLSLHIQIASPSRAEILLSMLKNELAREQWWREPAYDLKPEDPGAIERAMVACSRLREATSRLDAHDLVQRATESRNVDATTRFVRSGQAGFGIGSLDPQTDTAQIEITSYEYHRSTVSRLDMSMVFVRGCQWINALATGGAFDARQVQKAASGLELHEAQDLLGLLEQTRFIRRQD
ncbi:hypothetical protein LVJ94_18760 [Pendulispora rubella]|uniref:JmjC domain-containing protein n=1 Tax=Pendulispora rubella TaxID=2741070 RepID=A0ABZ2LEA1_9BACT